METQVYNDFRIYQFQSMLKNAKAQRGQLASQSPQFKRSILTLLLRCLDFPSSALFIIYCLFTECRHRPYSCHLLLGSFHVNPVEWE